MPGRRKSGFSDWTFSYLREDLLRARFETMKHSLLWLAILLIGLWVLARVILAATAVALHLLWIVAVIVAIIWLVRRVSRRA